MSYNFIDQLGGYTFATLVKEIKKFDQYDDLSNYYNATYVRARQSIDWLDFHADINEKVQFLIDWKTTIVRANREEYVVRFKRLAADHQLLTIIADYKAIELPFIDLSNLKTIKDISYIYAQTDSFLKPTSASKILHMFNPNLFPIWDSYMRKNLFRTTGHQSGQYVRWVLLMKEEILLIMKNTMSFFQLSDQDALNKIKQLDHPTGSLLRIMDKINYNNSRTPLPVKMPSETLQDDSRNQTEGGLYMRMAKSSGGKVDTGLRLSDFIRNYLPNIDGFSMNKEGGFTFKEEKNLWRQGKMTAAFLKQAASMLQYPTFQVSNYDLLHSLKSDRQKILELLKNKPALDGNIFIKSKRGGTTAASSRLKSHLLDD